MTDPKNTDDRFLVAWGEAEAWRGYSARADLLASLSTQLLASAPDAVFKVAHAIGNASALRHYTNHGLDALLPSLKSPYLHKALTDARTSRRGPARWRRYWLDRAVAYSDSVEGELMSAINAQTRLYSFSRALVEMREGLDEAMTLLPSNVPPTLGRDWDALIARLSDAKAGLIRLDERISRLVSGIEALQVKSEALVEVCHAMPSNEDILRSQSFQDLVKHLFTLPPSGIPGALE